MQGKRAGKENSQFGTCWITKNGLNKKIKKEELNTFIEQGWVKGRTLNSKGSVVIMVKLLPVKQHDVSSNLTGPAISRYSTVVVRWLAKSVTSVRF